jgi:hypothetical protein
MIIVLDGRGSSRPWTGLSRDGSGPAKPVLVDCRHEHVDRNICTYCGELLAGVLDDVPALLDDLVAAEIKDVRFVEHGSLQYDRGESSVVLPWSERASKARVRLVFELTSAADICGLPADTEANLARRLRRFLPTLCRRDDGPEWAARITHAAAAAHAAIDRPPSPWYYGPCPLCRKDLYQERIADDDHESKVTCSHEDCAYSESLHTHRLIQLDAGEDRMLTVGELVGAITSAGETVTRHQINNWIKREGLPREQRVRPRMVNGGMANHEVYVYRLGDVRRMALVAEIRQGRP